MTSINAGGAFYRVQNSLNQNSEQVSKSMQRLASGRQNISPGDRTGSVAVAYGMKAELASLKVGMQNATEVLQVMEMANNDLGLLNDMIVRLEELNALGSNGLNSDEDKAAIRQRPQRFYRVRGCDHTGYMERNYCIRRIGNCRFWSKYNCYHR